MTFRNQITTFYTNSQMSTYLTTKKLILFNKVVFLIDPSNKNKEYLRYISTMKLSHNTYSFISINDELNNYIYLALDNNPITTMVIKRFKEEKKTIFIFSDSDVFSKIKDLNYIDVVYKSDRYNWGNPDNIEYFVGKNRIHFNINNFFKFLKRSLIFERFNLIS